MEPVGALADGVGACFAQFCEVGRENRGRDDGGGRHGGRLYVIDSRWATLHSLVLTSVERDAGRAESLELRA